MKNGISACYVRNGKSTNDLVLFSLYIHFLVISFCNLCNEEKKWMRKNQYKVYVSKDLPH